MFSLRGGRDASGKLLDDAWYFTGELGWKKIALPSGVLGEVRSSAYSYRDGHLWVLDVDPLEAKRLRVLRIEPETGAFDVVLRAGSDHTTAKYDDRGLLIGMNGEVLLYASSTRAQKHRIAALETIPGGVVARMTLRRDRALAAPPIVDLHGIALYFQPDHPPQDRSKNADDDPRRTSTIAGLRLDSLPLRAATLQQVEELLR